MQSNFEKVLDFHQTYGQLINEKPTLIDEETSKLRYDLIEEELEELAEAMAADDLVGIADALTDILYVVYGAGVSYGINLDETFEEVQRSNMSKLDEDGNPIYREDGKVLKGPYYSPPDIETVLNNSKVPV